MELDATQALDTDYGDEEIEEAKDRKTQVAEVRVQKVKGFEANNFIIYEGQNIVGRHEKADVYIPLKPLSKKHACIEVVSGQHFIYDFGSKNKTRRGKMILRPNVRYELTDGCQLLFADVKCEYKFIEIHPETDDTDSMSEAIDSEEDTEKQKLNVTNEDIYAAETDSDTDNENEKPGGATPAPSSQLISIVKQTPGTLLHQIQRGSLNDTTDSTKLINDSMQSLEASNLSLKLDITLGSETALSPSTNQSSGTSKTNQSQSNEVATLVLQEELSPSTNQNNARSKTNQSQAEEIATLVLQEELSPSTNQNGARNKTNQSQAEEIAALVLHDSDDETDGTETAKTALLESSDLGLSEEPSARPKEIMESKETAGLSVEPSTIPRETGGLLIQESDEESTDMSDNEAIKSDIAGSGFFSPDLMLQKYGMKKLDGSSETDRSDAESLFSPGVVRNYGDVGRNRHVVKDDNIGGGANEENSEKEGGGSQEYMLMPTQAYGIMDSDNDSTDVEDNGITDENLASNRNEKLPASTESKLSKENNAQNSSSKIDQNSLNMQMQDTVPLEGSLLGDDSMPFRALRQTAVDTEQTVAEVPTEPTMPLEAAVPMEATVPMETALSNKVAPSKDLFPAKHRIAPTEAFLQTAETVPMQDSATTDVSMNDSLTASALYDSIQETDTVSIHDSEVFDKIMDENAPKSNPMQDDEQDAATVPLHNSDQGPATVPLRDSDRIAATIPLQNSAQEAATVPVHDTEQDAMTVQLQDTSSLEETMPLAETGIVVDNAVMVQIADTVPVQDEASSYTCDEEATQGYDILPPRKQVEKRKNKQASEAISTFTLPGGSTLKHVTFGAGAGAGANQRGRSNTESSDTEETQAYLGDDDCATQAYGVEAATVPYDCVVEETQEDDDANTATQAYGYLDQPTLLYESPVGSPTESKTGKAQETDVEECATQAYGLLEQPTVPYDDEDGGSNEIDSNDVDKTDVEDCATQAYGLLGQPTVPYDDEVDGSNENDSKHANEDVDDCATQAYGLLEQPTVPYDDEDSGSNENNPTNITESAYDDCATQAYGLLDQPTVTYDLQGDDEDNGSAMDECATQAYGLQDQATLSYDLSPESPAKDRGTDRGETAIDECETQAYGVEDDPAVQSEEEDCATQAYGVMDVPTVPYEDSTGSPIDDSNKNKTIGDAKRGQPEDQGKLEDQLSESLFAKPAVPTQSRGKTKMAASKARRTLEDKETDNKIEDQASDEHESTLPENEADTSSRNQETSKRILKNRGKEKDKIQLDNTEYQSLVNTAKKQASKGKGSSKKSVRNKVTFEDDDIDVGDQGIGESEMNTEGMQVTAAVADGRKKTASTRRKKASANKDAESNQNADTAEKQHEIGDVERSFTETGREDGANSSSSLTAARGRRTKRGGRASTSKSLDKAIETGEERVGVNVKDSKGGLTEVVNDSAEQEAAVEAKGGSSVRRGRPSKKKIVVEALMDEEGAVKANESNTTKPQPTEEEQGKNKKGKGGKRETAAAKRGRASAERTIGAHPVGTEEENESEQDGCKLKGTEADKSAGRGIATKKGRSSAERTMGGDPVGTEEENESEHGSSKLEETEANKSAKRGKAAKRGRASADRTEQDNSKLKEEEASKSNNLKRKSVNRGGSAKRGRPSAKRTKEAADADEEENTNETESETIVESNDQVKTSTKNIKSKTTKKSVVTNNDKDTTKTTDVQREMQTPSAAANCSADEFDARSSGGRGRKRGKQSSAMNQSKLSDNEDSPGPSKKDAKEDSAGGNRSAKGRNSRGKSTTSKLTDDSPNQKSSSLRPTLRDLEVVPKIMFTGLTDKSAEKSVTQLGAELADSVYDATHLVTDKVRRTVKFLCCLARGIDIVEPSWLEHCRSAKEFMNEKKYTVDDKNTEKQYNFDLKRSIALAKEKELLDGYSLYVTKNVKPDQKQMKDIIHCSGGKALLKLPKSLDEKTLIISCEEDKTEIKNLTQSGVPVYTAELLLTGILRQELNFEQFKLEVGSESTKKTGKRTQSTSELDKSVSSAKRRKR